MRNLTGAVIVQIVFALSFCLIGCQPAVDEAIVKQISPTEAVQIDKTVANERYGVDCASTAVNHDELWHDNQLVARDVHPTGLQSEMFNMGLLALGQGNLMTAKGLFYRVATDERLVAPFPQAPCTFLTHMAGFSTFQLVLIGLLDNDRAFAETWVEWSGTADIPPIFRRSITLLLDTNGSLTERCETVNAYVRGTYPDVNERMFAAEAVDITNLCQLPQPDPSAIPYTFTQLNLPETFSPPSPYQTVQPTPTYVLVNDYFQNRQDPTPAPTVTYGSELREIWEPSGRVDSDLSHHEQIEEYRKQGEKYVDSHRPVAEWIAEQREQGETFEYVRGALDTHYRYSSADEINMTASEGDEWLFLFVNNAGMQHNVSSVFVIDQTGDIFEHVHHESIDSPNSSGLFRFDKIDMTGDGYDDLLLYAYETGRTHHLTYQIITEDGGEIRVVLDVEGFGLLARPIHGTYDDAVDLQVRQRPSGVSWICRFDHPATVYAWNGEEMEAMYSHDLPSHNRNHYFRQATEAYTEGELGRALDLYTRFLTNRHMISHNYKSACDYPKYNEQYAAYRLVLMYKMRGDDTLAQAWHDWMVLNYRNDTFTSFAGSLLHTSNISELEEMCATHNERIKEWAPDDWKMFNTNDDIELDTVCEVK